MLDLKKLHKDHELRNKPLGEIGARYRGVNSLIWQEVRPAYNISKRTFNDLGSVWLIDEWECNENNN